MSRRRPGFTMIELIAVVALITVLISLLLPAVQAAREAARRAQCANNLLQLGVALQSYEATHRVLPPGVVDRSGPVIETPTSYQFGWITQILPFMEARALHRNLDFNAGVYAPANLTARLIHQNHFACPSDSRGRSSVGANGVKIPWAFTNYAACHNDREAPIDVGNTGCFYLNSRVRLDEVEDGLACTIFLGEKFGPGDELGWASGTRATLRNTGTPINQTSLNPSETLGLIAFPMTEGQAPPGMIDLIPPDPDAPPAPAPGTAPIRVGGFGSRHSNGSNFGFGDGSVRFLLNTIDRRVYQLLGSRADGEPIGDDRF